MQRAGQPTYLTPSAVRAASRGGCQPGSACTRVDDSRGGSEASPPCSSGSSGHCLKQLRSSYTCNLSTVSAPLNATCSQQLTPH